MRPLLFCGLALLGGCSTISTLADAWSWDATLAPNYEAVAPADTAASTTRLSQLQQERVEVRNRISAEPDISVRQRLYADLHRVGMALSPLERRLALRR